MSMWTQDLIDNRNRVLARIEMIRTIPREFQGTYLHLGCGPQIYDGWVNIDKFQKDPNILNFDMYRLPYVNGFADAIYSSHALEHLPFRKARAAIVEWSRVLKPGGRLFLAVPDLELIMRVMLSDQVEERLKWDWFVYTLFGWQVDPNYRGMDPEVPLDHGQFHYCGFTQRSISTFLEDAGLEVKMLFQYDGWDTPSLWVEATKK